MSYRCGAIFSSSSSVRTPAMPLPTITSRDFFMAVVLPASSAQGDFGARCRGPRGARDRFHLALLLVQEREDLLAAVVVGLVLRQLDAVARAGQRHVQDLPDAG